MDANVSVSEHGDLGTRTEIKNIGSVRALAAAIKYEIGRHISILESNGEIFNETRAWDAESKTTVPMREKEDKEVNEYFCHFSMIIRKRGLSVKKKKNKDE